jgi:predicted MFS family arabinose efflux permease
VLRVWNLAFAIGDAAWIAFFAAVPVLVLERFDADPRIAGLLFAGFGLGAVIGNAIAYRYLLKRVDGMRLIATCIMGQAIPLWLLTLELPAAAICAVLVVSGVANGLVNPSIHSLMTLRIPPALRPTVMTTMMIVWAAAYPLGLFAAGPVLDAFGTEPVLVAFAAVQTAAMAVVAVVSARAAAAPKPVPEQA